MDPNESQEPHPAEDASRQAEAREYEAIHNRLFVVRILLTVSQTVTIRIWIKGISLSACVLILLKENNIRVGPDVDQSQADFRAILDSIAIRVRIAWISFATISDTILVGVFNPIRDTVVIRVCIIKKSAGSVLQNIGNSVAVDIGLQINKLGSVTVCID